MPPPTTTTREWVDGIMKRGRLCATPRTLQQCRLIARECGVTSRSADLRPWREVEC
jgi:hypothetical protein